MKKPLIGMAYSDCATRDHEMRVRTYCTHKYYWALQKAGAQVILLPPVTETTDFERTLSLIDGLLLPGGEDIDPLWQNEDPVPGLGLVNPWRDEYELKLAKTCFERKIPTLGICRGIQIMAVALGGSLHQDIKGLPGVLKHEQSAPRWYASHEVKFQGSSLLKSWLDEVGDLNPVGHSRSRPAKKATALKIRVNSFHHQMVKTVSKGCRAVGFSGDGLIEALEAVASDRVYVGVQWHPEELFDSDPVSRALFTHFVQAVADCR